MKHIALFGGSFDPPHSGHLMVVNVVLNSGFADEVWLIPAGDGRYDKRPRASAAHREAMLKLLIASAFSKKSAVYLNTVQFQERLHDCATIELYDEMRRQYPEYKFSVIIGADNVKQVPDWKQADRLLKEVEFIVVARAGEQLPENYAPCFKVIKDDPQPCTNLSSSLIRKLTLAGKSLEGLIPLSIIDYVRANKLYEEDSR